MFLNQHVIKLFLQFSSAIFHKCGTSSLSLRLIVAGGIKGMFKADSKELTCFSPSPASITPIIKSLICSHNICEKITYHHYITMSNWKMSDLLATILMFTSQAFPPAWVLCRLPVGISFIRLHPSWPHLTSKIWPNPYCFLQQNRLGEGDDNKVDMRSTHLLTHLTDMLKIAIFPNHKNY